MQAPGFLPKTLAEWIGALAVVGGWIVSGTVVWTKLVSRINGLGERVDVLTKANSEKDGRMSRYDAEMADLKRGLAEGIARLGRVEQGVDGVETHLSGIELRLLGELRGIGDKINERDSALRERVARLESFHKAE